MTDLGIARDTEGHVVGCFEKALAMGVDMLITSGEPPRENEEIDYTYYDGAWSAYAELLGVLAA